ncbi:hypothetical protein [Frondihabitans cladoniiphilus]|uniref:ABC transporter permease n=1 Tax=Frondihabitans cladoniiphilus TaxID=715785 RepID=A0ABP8VZI3_9MICO
MSWRAAIGEGLRDIASGASRPLLFAILFAVTAGGAATWGAVDTTSAVLAADAYVEAGAATFVETSPGRIDGRACDSLVDLASVRAAGAVRESPDGLVAEALPRTRIPLFTATQGFSDVIGFSAPLSLGVVVSTEVASILGATPGATVATMNGPTTVAGVYDYPDDGREAGLAYAAVEAASSIEERYDACWMTVWPEDETAVAALSRTVISADEASAERPTLRQLNSTKGDRFVDHRTTSRPLVGGLAWAAATLSGFGFVWFRRLVVSADRHAGMGRRAQILSLGVQAGIWSLSGSALSFVAVICVTRVSEQNRDPTVWNALVVLLIAMIGAQLGTAAGVATVRERHFFRYFKER